VKSAVGIRAVRGADVTTVQLATISKGLSFLDWLDDFLYLPETLYIIILVWLICSGPGRVSVDDWIARALGYQDGESGERAAGSGGSERRW
jgi:membrane protein required for beta-lactamase induction